MPTPRHGRRSFGSSPAATAFWCAIRFAGCYRPSTVRVARNRESQIAGRRRDRAARRPIHGHPSRSLGESFELELSGCRIIAKIVRVEANAFAVAFIHSFETRVALTRHSYAAGYAKPLGAIKAAKVGAAVLRRLLD
jgi:hypothetical protein